MKIAVFPGSFCPVTKGHINAISRAARIVDKLYVVVGVNSAKTYAISPEDRVGLLQKALIGTENISICAYDGLMTDFCITVGADLIIKSVRNAVDVQTVIDTTEINKHYWNGETIFLTCDKEYQSISSSMVRELASLGKDITPYVPNNLASDIVALLRK
ncbi:MAG: pantetheine-phosphate adenylyltransferase [Clostridia bacterium]